MDRNWHQSQPKLLSRLVKTITRVTCHRFGIKHMEVLPLAEKAGQMYDWHGWPLDAAQVHKGGQPS